MRLSLSLLTALSAASSLAAQPADNRLWNYASDAAQTCTSFTSRHNVGGPEDGWACKIFHKFCAIGNNGNGLVANPGSINGYTMIIQDQSGVTTENYDTGIVTEVGGVPGGGLPCPVTGAPELILTSGSTPTPGSSNSGPVAWRVTFTLAAGAANLLPVTGEIYQAVFQPNNAAWTMDGFSWQGSWGTAGTSGYTENVGPSPNFTVTCNETQGIVIDPGAGQSNRNPHGGILTPAGVHDLGLEVDPAFSHCTSQAIEWGCSAHYPNASTRNDGMHFRLRDANNPGAPCAVFISLVSPAAGPLAVPGIKGWICLDLSGLLQFPIAAGALDGSGQFVDGSVWGRGAGGLPVVTATLETQGVILTPGGACMTNSSAFAIN